MLIQNNNWNLNDCANCKNQNQEEIIDCLTYA